MCKDVDGQYEVVEGPTPFSGPSSAAHKECPVDDLDRVIIMAIHGHDGLESRAGNNLRLPGRRRQSPS